MDELRRAFHLLCAERLGPEMIPQVAAEALARGVDSPLLRELAGAPVADVRSNRDLLHAAMSELLVDAPSRDDIELEVLRSWAADMLAGRLSPYEATERIWKAGLYRRDCAAEIDTFVSLADRWEVDWADRAAVEEAMMIAARVFLDQAPAS